MRVHRKRNGTWVTCQWGRVCRARFHLPDLTPQEAAGIPLPVLVSLLEPWQPHTHTNGDTKMWWRFGQIHRSYDLPAVIREDGALVWYRRGHAHRSGGKPAVIEADGSKEYWRNGVMLISDKPRIRFP